MRLLSGVSVVLFAALMVVALPVASRAQDSAAEVRQLRRELEEARRQIQVLQEENARLRAGQGQVIPALPTGAPSPSVVPSANSVGTPSTSPLVAPGPSPGTLVVPAPLPDGTLVTVEQLLADYSASALAGDARYKGRRLRVQGKVEGFEKVFVRLNWIVELQAPDRLGAVRAQVTFPGISDFRPSESAGVLEGRRPFKAWQVLLRRGETVVLEGVCEGIRDAVIVLKDARPAAAGS